MTLSKKLLATFQLLKSGASDFAFPTICSVCAQQMSTQVKYVCVRCRSELVTLDLHTLAQNTMTDRFWARLPVQRAAALLPYTAGSPAQRIMWLLKYDNRPDLGLNLGAWLGTLLANNETFGPVDAIVAVPLHPKKLRVRGYNQAERIAAGLALSLGAPHLANAVVRTRHTETQTRKGQFQRMVNVDEVFQLSPKQTLSSLTNKHVLLVDDVMTTGATLEALGKAILPAKPASFKVATLALARK